MSLKNLIKNTLIQGIQIFVDWLAKPRIISIKVPFMKSTYEKISFLREYYAQKYRAEEMKTKVIEIPYFLRTNNKLNEIIQNNEIDFEYKKCYLEKTKKERCK